MKTRMKKKTSVKDKVLITIFSIVIVASVVSVAAVFLLNTSFFKNKETNENGKINENLVTPTEIKDKYVNFLVVGVDYIAGSSRGHLTDTIMVISFDIQGNNIDVLHIPRDSYIGNLTSTGKINSIYGKSENGGINGLADTIFNTFNITIDHYVTVDMTGFVSIVDKIGGVEVDVPQRIKLEGATLEPGLQVLDGWRAQKFVRERKSYSNGDLGRIDMQKVFMKALIEKIFKMGKKEVLSLAPTLVKEITTDLTLGDMLGYYNKLLDVDKTNNINFYTVPVLKGGSYRGNSVVLLDKEKTAELLNQYFRPYTKKVSAEELGIQTL